MSGRRLAIGWTICALAALAAGAVFPSAEAQDAAPAVDGEAGAPVPWGADYELALEEALLTRRPVLLTFYAPWCGWCRKLEREAFRDQRFVRLCREVIPVRIDGEKEQGLAALFSVRGYPVTLVISRRGRVLGRITGYRPAAAFLTEVARALKAREPVAEARRAAQERPEDPEAQYALGDVLLAAGEYAEAREAFRRTGELSAAGDGAWTAAARLDEALAFYLAGEYEAAVPAFEDYLTGFPGDDRRDQGLYFCGRALVALGRVEEGRARIEEAAERTTFRIIRREAERLRARFEEEGHGG